MFSAELLYLFLTPVCTQVNEVPLSMKLEDTRTNRVNDVDKPSGVRLSIGVCIFYQSLSQIVTSVIIAGDQVVARI